MTIAIRAPGIFPSAMLLAMASKFEPRPERRMPMFFMESTGHLSSKERAKVGHQSSLGVLCLRVHRLRVHHLALALHHTPDVVILLADALEQGLRLLELLGVDYQQHAE